MASSVGIHYALEANYKPGVEVGCIASEGDREKLKALTLEALDDAYKDQVKHLFQVWMRDSQGQPQRAQTGVGNAGAAWLGASASVSVFAPPSCPRKG